MMEVRGLAYCDIDSTADEALVSIGNKASKVIPAKRGIARPAIRYDISFCHLHSSPLQMERSRLGLSLRNLDFLCPGIRKTFSMELRRTGSLAAYIIVAVAIGGVTFIDVVTFVKVRAIFDRGALLVTQHEDSFQDATFQRRFKNCRIDRWRDANYYLLFHVGQLALDFDAVHNIAPDGHLLRLEQDLPRCCACRCASIFSLRFPG